MKRFFYYLIFLFCFSSCENEVKPAVFEVQTIEKSYDANITLTFDKATGNSSLSKTINTNIEKAITESLNSAEKETSLDHILKAFNSEFKTFQSNFSDEGESVWELHIETELTYQSADIITIGINTYEFKGGAHGNDKISFLNLNAKTGDLLKLNDFVDNLEAFKRLAKNSFIKSLETENSNMDIKDFFFGKPFQLPENIGFSEDGLVFLYNAYEIASYDEGYTEFVIPIEDVNAYLKLY